MFVSAIAGATGLAATATAVTFTAAALSAITVGIITTAAGYLLTTLFAPKVPRPEDGHVPIQQSVPYRNFGYGQTRIAGAVMCLEEYSNDLYVITALVSHPIASFEEFYLNDDQIEFTSAFDGTVEGGPNTVAIGPKGQYGIGCDLWWRLGLPGQTVLSDFVTGLNGMWPAEATGEGQTYMAMRCLGIVNPETFTKRYPSGRPQPSAVMRLALVWDFRDDAQDPTDPSTWAWSNNPVLCLAHFECFNEFGPQRDYTKALLPVIDLWKAEADVCDEPIALLAGGTQPRYQLGGWSTAEIDPKATRLTILSTFDGWMAERGDGALLIVAGKYRAPTITLTDDDIAGFYIEGDIPAENGINSEHVAFNSPEHGYAEVEADPWEDTDDQATRGKLLATTMQLHWTQDYRMARRLAKREFYRARKTLRGSLDVRLSGINAIYERWITINSPTIPRLNGVTVENKSARIDIERGGFTIEFVGCGPEIDDWTPATDEGAAPPLPPVTNPGVPAIPGNLNVVAEFNAGIAHLVCSWDDPSDPKLTYDGRWRFADDGTGNPGPWTPPISFGGVTVAAGRITGIITDVPENSILEVEVRSARNYPSDWTPPVTVDTTPSVSGADVLGAGNGDLLGAGSGDVIGAS